MGITPTNDGGANWEIYLDLTLTIYQILNQLKWRLYRKPGNCYNYPHAHTYLPKHTKIGFITGELKRIYQNCMLHKDLIDETSFFVERLITRGYRFTELIAIIKKVVKSIKSNTNSKKEIDYDDIWIATNYNNILNRKEVERQLTEKNGKKTRLAQTNHKKVIRWT